MERAYKISCNGILRISLSNAEFDDLANSSGWSLDSWIQAAANEHLSQGKSAEAFNELIESILYSKIRDKSKDLGIEKNLTKVLNYPKIDV